MLKLQKCFSLSGFISFDPPSTENKTQISLLASFSVYSQFSVKADGIMTFLKLPQCDFFFFFFPSAGNETKVCTATPIKIFYFQFC